MGGEKRRIIHRQAKDSLGKHERKDVKTLTGAKHYWQKKEDGGVVEPIRTEYDVGKSTFFADSEINCRV